MPLECQGRLGIGRTVGWQFQDGATDSKDSNRLALAPQREVGAATLPLPAADY